MSPTNSQVYSESNYEYITSNKPGFFDKLFELQERYHNQQNCTEILKEIFSFYPTKVLKLEHIK